MLCKKCNCDGTVVIRKVSFLCDTCFVANIIHKFRACIGKNTKLSKDDKALVCLSGDVSSSVLLDLVMNGISLTTHKKLQITPFFLHVYEIFSSDDSVCQSIVKQCKKYNVDLISVNFSDMVKNITEEDIMLKTNDLKIPTINKFGNDISSSVKKDVLSKLKQRIFYKIAKDLKCNIIFTSEINTKLSAKLLSNIVMGRGSQIENDVGFADLRNKDVKLLRPLRDISEEELNHYVRIKQLSYANEVDSGSSLQSLIENFISNLEINAPATISTICKTADKISSADNNTDKSCQICQINLKTKPDKLTAIDATVFSKIVSSGGSNGSLTEHTTLNTQITQYFESIGKIEVFPYIFSELCYSCSKNYNELKRNTIIH